MGVGVAADQVSLELVEAFEGSLRIQITIVFSVGSSVGAETVNLLSSASFGPGLAERLADVRGIAACVTSSIRVGGIEILSSTRKAITRRPSSRTVGASG